MRETAGQATRYLIGALIALALDAAVMLLLTTLAAPIVIARIAALMVGISTTYFFNRAFTFDAAGRATFSDWFRYLLAQSVGAALNFSVSTAVVYASDRSALWVVAGVCAGAAVGFSYNFFAAKKLLHKPNANK